MYCINVHTFFFYVLLTLLNKYQIVNKTLILMVKKQLNILTSQPCVAHDDKNAFYFGGLGQNWHDN